MLLLVAETLVSTSVLTALPIGQINDVPVNLLITQKCFSIVQLYLCLNEDLLDFVSLSFENDCPVYFWLYSHLFFTKAQSQHSAQATGHKG